MKVVCNGKDKVYERTCSNCNSDLEYTESDVFYTTEKRSSGIGRTDIHFFKKDEHYIGFYKQDYCCIRCPVCGNVIKMPDFSKGLPDLREMEWVKST
jgi:transcription initiation factor IIE alpha subunit